jgi:hypothetical protein
LTTARKRWLEEVIPESFREDDRAFPVGHPEFQYTQLPARDARFEGRIRRSNRFPNCSYLTQWRALGDRITWEVEVLKGGKFEAELYYACPADDVGAVVVLRCGEQQLIGKVNEPHDPPLLGREHDRWSRQESYVKRFRPWRMGVIELTEGAGRLSLQASAIPGSQVMEFRTLMLTRVE